jgi:4-hydroxy-3-methylbut-2-enyl diphosphate reductase
VAHFQERGPVDVEELHVVPEDVRFMLPKEIRQALAAAS